MRLLLWCQKGFIADTEGWVDDTTPAFTDDADQAHQVVGLDQALMHLDHLLPSIPDLQIRHELFRYEQNEWRWAPTDPRRGKLP